MKDELWILKLINDYWRFDNNQQPLSNWHEKQDLLEEVQQALNKAAVSNPWLSPIESERAWQEKHIKKIWEGYPNSCPNWQVMNGLITLACEAAGIEVEKP